MPRKISITGSTSFSEIKTARPQNYAAGFGGIKTALDHVNKELGVFKGLPSLSKMNQKDGFDCPGCAWPDPAEPSKLGEYCENGAKAFAEEATEARVDRGFFEKYSVEEISQWTDMEIGKSGRITEPFILKPGKVHYEPISWDGAFQIIAKNLKTLKSPNDGIFYTSGRSSNEAAFLYGLFIRAFGTHNMPDCSNMCHESSGVALKETLGIGKGSVTVEDLHIADVIMVVGQNPGTNHPRMLSALQKCKENGGKIIAVNPLKEAGLIKFKNPQEVNGILGNGVNITDLYLQVKINQDVPLFKLLLKKLIERDKEQSGVLDHDFIQEKTQGWDEVVADLANYDEQDLIEACGIDSKEIEEAVKLLANGKKIIICWAMGLTQHKNGVENIKECVNLLLAKGSIGKPGAGTCPVRGHSNVQGDRTVGIVHHASQEFNQSIKEVFGFDAPEQDGLDTVGAIKAMHEEPGKVFVALGGNFLSAASDTSYTAKALQNCKLIVSISTKLNRTHLVAGETSLILPTLGRSEKDEKKGRSRFVTVENSMGIVHQSKGINKPASANLMSEPEIVGRIAEAYFKGNHPVQWKELGEDYDQIREKISKVLEGFEDYSNRSKASGFSLPNNAREADFSNLPNGRAQFSVCGMPDLNVGMNEFILMTIRSHDQFNTTIYGMDDRYRGIFNERRVVFMNEADMGEQGLASHDVVNLISDYGYERKAESFKVIPYDIPKRNLAAYYPETNVLVPFDHYADKSHTPISKSVVVRLEKV